MLNSESLNNVLENKVISRQDIAEIYQNALEDPGELFSAAQSLREKFKKDYPSWDFTYDIDRILKEECELGHF